MRAIRGKLLTAGLMVLFYSVTGLSATEANNLLVLAAKNQDWKQAETLLTRDNVNNALADGSTALAWAVYWDQADAAKSLLDTDADPNIGNDYGVTPLVLSIENRNAEIAGLLLKAGADPNARLWNGVTPLMMATKSGESKLVSLLLDQGADINARDTRRNQSALMWAIAFGHRDIARLLIDRNADVNASTTKLDADFRPMILEGYGANVEGTIQGGYTPLMFAAQAGDLETARLLINKGANLHAVSDADGTVLVIAAAGGHDDLAMFLLEQGADPNMADSNGITPLHYAMRDGLKAAHGYRIDNATLLCGFADDSRCKPLEEITELDKELMKDQKAGLYIVEPKESRYDVLPGGNMYDFAEALLARGADPNARIKYSPSRMRLERLPWYNTAGATPIFLASASRDMNALEMLLEHGAEPLVKTEIDRNVFEKQQQHHEDNNQIIGDATPLMVAVGIGRINDFSQQEEDKALVAAQRLVSLGADVNAATSTGWTPVHAAAYIGANRVVKFLAENGANVDIPNGCGQTPVDLAIGRKLDGLIERTQPHIETAYLLMELGAGDQPLGEPVGVCILGRGGLEADIVLRARIEDVVRDVESKLNEKRMRHAN